MKFPRLIEIRGAAAKEADRSVETRRTGSINSSRRSEASTSRRSTPVTSFRRFSPKENFHDFRSNVLAEYKFVFMASTAAQTAICKVTY